VYFTNISGEAPKLTFFWGGDEVNRSITSQISPYLQLPAAKKKNPKFNTGESLPLIFRFCPQFREYTFKFDQSP